MFLVQPLCPPLFSGRDSCSFVLQCPASGLVRTAAFFNIRMPPFLDFVLFPETRGKEKKEAKASNKNAKTDSSLRPGLARISSSPLPRLGSSRINVTRPSILSGFPLHPPNFLSAARGKREKAESLKPDDSFSSSSSNAFHQTPPERPKPSGFVPTPVHQQANAQL